MTDIIEGLKGLGIAGLLLFVFFGMFYLVFRNVNFSDDEEEVKK